MKKIIRLTAGFITILMLAAFAAGCTKPKPEEPEPTGIPGIEQSLIGDWYGVFSVTDADGKYRDNSGLMNDCVMRLATGENGSGSCYIAVNGMGELFDECSAEAAEEGVLLTGKIAGSPVSWRLIRRGAKLTLSEIYGAGTDYMRIELILKHCGEEWSGSPIPAGYEYTVKHGFGSLVEAMGGDKSKLPVITGEGVNLRLSEDVESADAEPEEPRFNDEGRCVSSNGCFSVALPEGFSVTYDGTDGLRAANAPKGVKEVSWSVYVSNEDPLKKLINLDPESAESSLYHFVIDGFDCYASPMALAEGGSELVLLGTDGANMLEIHYAVDTDEAGLAEMLRDDPAFFNACVLGLLVHPAER